MPADWTRWPVHKASAATGSSHSTAGSPYARGASRTAHDLIVTGNGVSAHTPVLAPGQTVTLRFDAPRGILLTPGLWHRRS